MPVPNLPAVSVIPPQPTDKPPLLPSWRAWYWLVLGALGAEIGLFVYLTRLFA
ncbi:hypothetical protein [Hymenobacter amundsenii]|uniref:hypothetical protein n=1 Tax=Hymenobacter amundsenii TaxID=2006685 RepID=UPI0013FE379B|nr:hypothetical protein [Hymenobacter amundsenii]